jgi:hypothetical protein
MLTDENCEQVRQMGNCIDDTLPEGTPRVHAQTHTLGMYR